MPSVGVSSLAQTSSGSSVEGTSVYIGSCVPGASVSTGSSVPCESEAGTTGLQAVRDKASINAIKVYFLNISTFSLHVLLPRPALFSLKGKRGAAISLY